MLISASFLRVAVFLKPEILLLSILSFYQKTEFRAITGETTLELLKDAAESLKTFRQPNKRSRRQSALQNELVAIFDDLAKEEVTSTDKTTKLFQYITTYMH